MAKYQKMFFFFFKNFRRFSQNMKIDADIVIIDAVEILTFRSPFDKKWGFALESR